MLVVVVDDERTFQTDSEVIYCRSSNEALSTLSKIWINQWYRKGTVIAELWLDHDLSADDTIMPVVEWLSLMAIHPDNPLITQIYVHTQNPVGGESIMSRLGAAGYNVKRVPLPEMENA
jgi:hypothetical protein